MISSSVKEKEAIFFFSLFIGLIIPLSKNIEIILAIKSAIKKPKNTDLLIRAFITLKSSF